VTTVVVNQTTNTVSVTQLSACTDVQQRFNAAVELRQSQTLATVSDAPRVVETSLRGLVGPPGETDGATFLAVAGETIHGGRVVRVDNGRLYHPDTRNVLHADQVIGIAVQSGSAGTELLVRTHGRMSEDYWGFHSGAVWCGDGGALVQTPPDGWLVRVGRSPRPNELLVDVEPGIFRAGMSSTVEFNTAALLPDAITQQPYSYQLEAAGVPPLRYAVTDGALPPGLTLSPTGLLSGTPL
jgi:hypothetical protein